MWQVLVPRRKGLEEAGVLRGEGFQELPVLILQDARELRSLRRGVELRRRRRRDGLEPRRGGEGAEWRGVARVQDLRPSRPERARRVRTERAERLGEKELQWREKQTARDVLRRERSAARVRNVPALDKSLLRNNTYLL